MLDIQDNRHYTSEDIKDILYNYINKKIHIKTYLGRNKYELNKGKITNIYDHMFTIIDDFGLIRSYSYSDIITKTTKIYIK